ncbi:MAG: adenylate/guanylate cyclase domain-containing protein [Prosthecobacter sp.]|uniref:adenylate/guanylate cyclase domain-containing protein n=1 Tax=Prosthecobacter sp. TaxID=1965333 RepID=UPI00390434FD
MGATLKSIEDGHEIQLGEHNIIGRGAQASVRVLDPSVSREHASLQHSASLFWLADLKSANGTLVNGTAITTRRALRHGDRVQFGTCSFIFEQDEPAKTDHKSTGGISTASLPVKTVKATLLVGDLQNFTVISAQLTASEVADMLREWYEDCQQVLKSRGATIDKFLGDGVIAYWPGDAPATRMQATEAARLLCGPAGRHAPQRQWLREHRSIEVICHVGLNVGTVALGPLLRGVSTIVGEALRVTSGIEGLTRKLEAPMLAGAAFLDGWPEGQELYQSAGRHAVGGTSKPLEVYELTEFATAAL